LSGSRAKNPPEMCAPFHAFLFTFVVITITIKFDLCFDFLEYRTLLRYQNFLNPSTANLSTRCNCNRVRKFHLPPSVRNFLLYPKTKSNNFLHSQVFLFPFESFQFRTLNFALLSFCCYLSPMFPYMLTPLEGYAKNEMSTILSSKEKKMSHPSDCHSNAVLISAKSFKEAPKKCLNRDLHASLQSESSWIPRTRDEKGTTKDPREPVPKVGDKVNLFTLQQFQLKSL
jgi:hypothetical protein